MAIERHETAKALELLDSFLGDHPDDGEARLYRGQLRSERGEIAAAIRDWRAVPDVPERFGGTARYLEGVDMLRRNKARDAERLLRRAVELNPSYLQPRERLLELYVGQRRKEAVRETLVGIRRLRPWRLEECAANVLAGSTIGSAEGAAARMEANVITDPEDDESGLALCRYRIDAGQIDEAMSRLRSLAVAGEKAAPWAAALLASTLLNRGDVAAAGEVLTGRPPEGGSPAELWGAAGRHAAATGDWSVAAERLREAARRDPFDVAVRHALGTALARQADPQADAVLEAATRLDRVERQASLVMRGLDRDPTLLATTSARIAEELRMLDLHDAAAAWFEQALARSPSDERILAGYRRSREASKASNPPKAEAGPPGAVSTNPWPRRTPPSAASVADPKPIPEIRLRDDGGRAGIDFTYANGPSGSKYIVETVGGGVAVIDYDSDGSPDLFFPQGGRPAAGNPGQSDRLYRNRGDGTFGDVSLWTGTEGTAYSLGATAADYDCDGFSDLAVANFGPNEFYRNNGDGTFDDATDETGIYRASCSSAMAFADFDRDGLPDLYIVNYVADPLRVCRNRDGAVATCDPQNFDADPDRVFRNRGDGTFDEVTSAAGVVDSHGKGLGIVAADFDGDGRCDLYVANDGSPNYLFLNASAAPGDIRFEEVGLRSGSATSGDGRSQAGMGVACADFDGEGTPDLYVTNFYHETNTLYLNEGGAIFSDATESSGHAGATREMLGFGTQAADFNLDGRPDLAVANGDIDDYSASGRPWKMRPLLFANLGDGRFSEVGRRSGDYFEGTYLGRGMARSDWNRDGLPDLVVVHYDRPVSLLTNVTTDPGGSLALDLRGVDSDRDAVGAVVLVTAGGRTQYVPVCGGHGYAASNDRRLLVGTGDTSTVDRLEIVWPNGKRQVAAGLPVNSTVLWVEGRQPVIRPRTDSAAPDER